MARPRILLADDHALILGAYERLLAPEFETVGQITDGRTLVAEADRLKPDVIILDLSMPLLNGLEATRQIKPLLPSAKVVMVTMHEDADLVTEAFRAGVSAYLSKRSAVSELLTAIREVLQGRLYVTSLLTEGLVTSLMTIGEHKPSNELTPRQREVLQLIVEGHSMKQIASVLNVTPRTVAFHKYAMMEHLNVKSTAELVQYAMKHHIV